MYLYLYLYLHISVCLQSVRDTAQENVMNVHEETHLFLVMVNQPKNITAISTRQTIIWYTLQNQLSRWNKDNITYIIQNHRICVGLAANLHSTVQVHPSWRLPVNWVPIQAGYISTAHWSLLHCTLSMTVHFNGSNGAADIRPLSAQYRCDIYRRQERYTPHFSLRFFFFQNDILKSVKNQKMSNIKELFHQ